ncbi:hypothetical protein ACOHYD_05630 [Desulfobacterota bacterium M19]
MHKRIKSRLSRYRKKYTEIIVQNYLCNKSSVNIGPEGNVYLADGSSIPKINTIGVIDPNRQLTHITLPGQKAYTLEYANNDGLLTAKVEPNGNRFEVSDKQTTP